MKTIAHYIAPYYLPHSETFIYDQLRTIKKFRQAVLTPEIKNNEFFPFAPIYHYKKEGRGGIAERLAGRWFEDNLFKFYLKSLKDCRANLIHAHFGSNGVYAVKLKKETDLPLAVHFYGQDASQYLKEEKWLEAYPPVFEQADLIFVVSKDMINDLRQAGFPTDKIVLIPIGINVNDFAFKERVPLAENEPVKFVFLGRFAEKKNPVGLIQAFDRVRKEHDNVELRLIGEGELKKEMLAEVETRQLTEKVKFLGTLKKDDVARELLDSQVLVLPSYTTPRYDKEATPSVLKEAMASGMPVIASRHAGIPELVEDKVNGFLVPEKDLDALAERMVTLVERQDLWRKFGLNGRKKVEKDFNLELQIGKQEAAYQKVI